MASEILINEMFAGSYLGDGNNIGHEIINLFKADDGINYLYITSTGTIPSCHNVESVVFVRNIKARKTVEVIAAATGLTRISPDEVEDIKYIGVPLRQIFRANIYRGDAEGSSVLATFKADEVLMPKDKSRIILTVDEDCAWEEAVYLGQGMQVVISQGMRRYCSMENNRDAYIRLRECILDMNRWEPAEATDRPVLDNSARSSGLTFLEIIEKADDELVFSNLLAYYFGYDHSSFQQFSRECLDIRDMDGEFDIVRESKGRIDLWIESENHVIVIENKIRSGINGINQEGSSQLNKYREYTLKHLEADGQGKQCHFFIFAPDYNSFDLSPYDLEDDYKIVRYSAIYEFFYKNAAVYLSDKYFPDFLKGLQRHAMPMAELNFNTMQSRFLEKIRRAQQ